MRQWNWGEEKNKYIIAKKGGKSIEKDSFPILSYAIFFLVLVFSTTLFAADASSGKQDPRKTSTAVTPATLNTIGKLPSLIKINPADLDMTTALFDANMVKAKKAWEDLNMESKDIATLQLPKLEKNISDMKTKMNECSNKAYTTEDQKNAGMHW